MIAILKIRDISTTSRPKFEIVITSGNQLFQNSLKKKLKATLR
jgi:hypothetical protein